MSELRELYQELILDHSKKPRNFRVLEKATHKSEGYNPLCGDRITVYLQIEGDTIRDVGFQGSGCAISKASTSMMTECVKGKTLAEVQDVLRQFKVMMLEGADPTPALGDLEALQGVRKFPVRVKCATLAWNVLEDILESNSRGVR